MRLPTLPMSKFTYFSNFLVVRLRLMTQIMIAVMTDTTVMIPKAKTTFDRTLFCRKDIGMGEEVASPKDVCPPADVVKVRVCLATVLRAEIEEIAEMDVDDDEVVEIDVLWVGKKNNY